MLPACTLSAWLAGLPEYQNFGNLRTNREQAIVLYILATKIYRTEIQGITLVHSRPYAPFWNLFCPWTTNHFGISPTAFETRFQKQIATWHEGLLLDKHRSKMALSTWKYWVVLCMILRGHITQNTIIMQGFQKPRVDNNSLSIFYLILIGHLLMANLRRNLIKIHIGSIRILKKGTRSTNGLKEGKTIASCLPWQWLKPV